MSGASYVVPGLVTIMMPVHNGAAYIRGAIDSAVAQQYTDWELVVVDDGSTDASYDIATSYADSRIRVLRQGKRGEAAARNAALHVARGEYVAFLDADDVYLTNHLNLVMGCFRTYPHAAGVFTDGFHITEHGDRIALLSARRRPPRSGHVFDDVVYGSDFLGPPICVVVRRDVIERHRLRFDEAIVIGPDWDFFVRVSALGPFQYVQQLTCLYRVHRGSITTTVQAAARRRERAKCRTRAIQLAAFADCAADVRFNVFHDLLVVALRGEPAQQQEVVGWPQFQVMPPHARSRLLRLIADEGILLDYDSTIIRRWLREAGQANRRDLKTIAVRSLYATHRGACRAVLRARRGNTPQTIDLPPFADLGIQ